MTYDARSTLSAEPQPDHASQGGTDADKESSGVRFVDRFTFDEIYAQERDTLGCKASPLSALCLSGGGIRSAAFCLGVIQAFAKARLLRHFHYLSTVSGGGYIGGFLTACIASQNQRNLSDLPIDGVAEVETSILAASGGLPSQELERLRKYTNYLTPNPGFASADTWAGITLWLRNTFVNWTVFLPCFLVLALAPIFYFSVLCMMAAVTLHTPEIGRDLGTVLATMALACLFFALRHAIVRVPSHDHTDRRTPGKPGLTGADVFWQIMIFAIAWSLLAPLAMAPALGLPEAEVDAAAALSGTRPSSTPTVLWHWLLLLPAVSFAVSLIAFRVAEWDVAQTFTREVRARAKQKIRDKERLDDDELWFVEHRIAFRVNATAWVVTSLLSAAMLLLGLWLAVGRSAVWVALFGPLWIIVTETLRISLYVALRQRALRADLDREWLARLSGVQLGYALALCGLGIATLLLPMLVPPMGLSKLWASLIGGGLLSGPLTALLGQSAKTMFLGHGSEETKPSALRLEWILYAGIVAFAVALLMLIGWLARSIVLLAVGLPHELLLCFVIIFSLAIAIAEIIYIVRNIRFFNKIPKTTNKKVARQSLIVITIANVLFSIIFFCLAILFTHAVWEIEPRGKLPNGLQFFITALACLVLAGGSVGLALWLSRMIDLNNFSMHAVYRNRLVRAFLGTARDTNLRKEDLFTNFDPQDDIRVADTFDRRKLPRLFPVINVALNRTSGKDMARAERKAESFTITPLHCGFASYWKETNGRRVKIGAYVPTAKFADKQRETGPQDKSRGITLGTAMTLSGAAVSPNMGYHSSPLVAFLMTLFNVRLGAWMPNPAMPILDPDDPRMIRNPRRSGLASLLSELVGRSAVDGEFVYLSDGGHVDNLGLYEMLLRRCRSIVVVDAGHDENYGYSDLGSTLRRARIDMGIEFHFVRTIGTRNKMLPDEGAYAEFTYPSLDRDGEREENDRKGRLVLLKSWLPGDAPTDLRAFQVLKETFPQESTANQFFKESDFESYRRLGEYLATTMIERSGQARPISQGDADPIAAFFEGLGLVASAKPTKGPRMPQPERASPDMAFGRR